MFTVETKLHGDNAWFQVNAFHSYADAMACAAATQVGFDGQVGVFNDEDDAQDDGEENFEDGDEGEFQRFEDDGQPTEYEEWQDYMGGDDWDHGQYDQGEDW